MVIDERVGSAELERLAEALAPPCQIGDFILEGLIWKTSTALIFVARGGAFGDSDGVLKLTGQQFAPLLERELRFLNRCHQAEIRGVVRPVRPELVWIELGGEPTDRVGAILLPFLAGGDLVQWLGGEVSRAGALEPKRALQIGEQVAGVLRTCLRLDPPLVHGDVKPQNVLLPHPNAPLTELTLIDFDASEEVETDLTDLAAASRDSAQRLVNDVHGFGELLYVLATCHEPPVEGEPRPDTGNPPFDALVLKCLTSEADGSGYVCLADNALWRDLETALAFERKRKRPSRTMGFLLSRAVLGFLAIVLFGALVVAIAFKLLVV